MGPTQQIIVLFESRNEKTGMFSTDRKHNLDQINDLLAQGWRVVSMSPTSSPTTDVGTISDVFALIVLERESAQ